MKRQRDSWLTISYVIYPPNYTPDAGYKKAKNLKAAQRAARGYGVGAEIWRSVDRQHHHPRFQGLRNAKWRCGSSFNYHHFSTLKETA